MHVAGTKKGKSYTLGESNPVPEQSICRQPLAWEALMLPIHQVCFLALFLTVFDFRFFGLIYSVDESSALAEEPRRKPTSTLPRHRSTPFRPQGCGERCDCMTMLAAACMLLVGSTSTVGSEHGLDTLSGGIRVTIDRVSQETAKHKHVTWRTTGSFRILWVVRDALTPIEGSSRRSYYTVFVFRVSR